MSSSIEELNQRFGIAGSIQFKLGTNSLVKAVLSHSSGHTLEVYQYGAHITSWKTPSGAPLLYLSPKSEFSIGKAIRGGIPLIFPQFGPGPLPQHGFARTTLWTVAGAELDKYGVPSLTLTINNHEACPGVEFEAKITILLEKTLILKFEVTNMKGAPFKFTNALHTYFSVTDIKETSVEGFQGVCYLDKLKEGEFVESRRSVTIAEETDRIYLKAPSPLKIIDSARVISVEKSHFADAVLWNPWSEKCAKMKDMEPESYKKFVCLEAGNADPKRPITLAEGDSWVGSQVISYREPINT